MIKENNCKYFYFTTVLLIVINFSCAQKLKEYPSGITEDVAIERIVKRSKKINSFKGVWKINDTINTKGFIGVGGPLMPFVSINKADTVLSFVGILLPYGFQINLKGDSCNVVSIVSSRSHKSFKSELSENELSYGAGANAKEFTVVLSKRKNLKIGDKIYGYINTKSNYLYHFLNEDAKGKYEKWNFEYEGYFEVDFKNFLQ